MTAAAHLGPFKGHSGTGSRDVRCPECTAPLAIHEFRNGVYASTIIAKRLVKLGEGEYGASKHHRDLFLTWDAAPHGRNTSWVAQAPIVIHCPTPQCGNRRVEVPVPSPVG